MWKEWLNFSKGERNGLIILFLLVCFAAIYPYIHRTLFYEVSRLANPADFHRIDSFFTSLRYEPKSDRSYFSFVEEEKPIFAEPELFRFDPNTVSSSELVRLGFSSRQAAVIENFRNKGGIFRSPSDFAKMYVVDDIMFQRLEPYIEIPPKSVSIAEQKNFEDNKLRETLVVDLNTTDTIELIKLRGIGSGYARRIVAYRQMLGGYNSIDQLKEVYGFPAELIESLKPHLKVDTLRVEKIDVNLVSYHDLRRHPYISEYQARAIVYYRETVGNIHSLQELKENKLLDAYSYNRLKGYLTVR
jgi:DNA uptake protein ComE-like DNA-binding protein